jgi:galactokinase
MMGVMNTNASEPEWHEPWARETGNALASALFQRSFGEPPTGVWSAAGRVNLIGEHTDYSDGLCLPTVLRHRTYVAASPRDDDALEIVSSADLEPGVPESRWHERLENISPESAAGWPAYPAGTVWALRERGYNGPGLNLAIESCVPIGVGLSSSAALTCATARAVNGVWKLALDSPTARVELAEATIEAENLIALTPTGGLDQYTSLFCTDGSAIEIDFGASPPRLRDAPLYFSDYGLVLLVIDTRTTHHLTDGRYADRFAECQKASTALGVKKLREIADDPNGLAMVEAMTDETLKKRARHVVSEIERVRIVSEELAGTGPASERFLEIGRNIYRSHTSLAVDFEISCPELDLAVNAAWTSGALGARLVGGGFGGAAIALVRRTQMDLTARTIDRSFAEAGFTRPRFLSV